MATTILYPEDPAEAVARVFSKISETRMAGLPFMNPALRVEAFGFQRWHGAWVGVMVSPWSINLMLLPAEEGALRALGIGQTQDWVFPSGEYEFMGGHEDELGYYQICSLFSPAQEFKTHEDAVETGRAALEVLMAEPDESEAGQAAAEADEAAQREQGRAAGKGVAELPLSRRGFLRGGFAK